MCCRRKAVGLFSPGLSCRFGLARTIKLTHSVCFCPQPANGPPRPFPPAGEMRWDCVPPASQREAPGRASLAPNAKPLVRLRAQTPALKTCQRPKPPCTPSLLSPTTWHWQPAQEGGSKTQGFMKAISATAENLVLGPSPFLKGIRGSGTAVSVWEYTNAVC